MRALCVTTYGPPEAASLGDVPDPVAGPGQVVVRVACASVNYPDVLVMADKYQISAPLPFTPGSECAGTVESLGDGVTDIAPGDRVTVTSLVGAFAEKIAAMAATAWMIPEGVDMRTAAAFGVTYRTAYHTLRSVAEVQPGQWVVVLGASGGVGSAAVDIARAMGAKVIAAASTQDKLDVCTARGADAVINYTTEDLKARIKEITGDGADVVVDPVGGDFSEAALRAVRWGGRFVVVGFASGQIPRIPLNLVLLKNVAILGFEIGDFLTREPAATARDDAELERLLVDGVIAPHVSAVFPLSQATRALRLVADRRSTGKVLIEP